MNVRNGWEDFGVQELVKVAALDEEGTRLELRELRGRAEVIAWANKFREQRFTGTLCFRGSESRPGLKFDLAGGYLYGADKGTFYESIWEEVPQPLCQSCGVAVGPAHVSVMGPTCHACQEKFHRVAELLIELRLRGEEVITFLAARLARILDHETRRANSWQAKAEAAAGGRKGEGVET